MKKTKQLKYEIIIGLKDKDTYEQMLPTSKFVEIVTSVIGGILFVRRPMD